MNVASVSLVNGGANVYCGVACDSIERLSFGRTLGRTSTSTDRSEKRADHVRMHSCVCDQLHLLKSFGIKNNFSRLRFPAFRRHAFRSSILFSSGCSLCCGVVVDERGDFARPAQASSEYN